VAAGGDWGTEHAVVGRSLIATRHRGHSSVVRLALADGHEEWRAPLPPWSQDVEVSTDEHFVYVTHTGYVANAPTPTIAFPRRVLALDLTTGRPAWKLDFAARPQQLSVSRGTIVATDAGDLVFIQGATGRVKARAKLGDGNIDPRMIIAGDAVYVTHDKAVSAFALETGKRLWNTPVGLDSGPELAALDDQLLVTTAAGSIAALERATGALRWDVGVGLIGYRLHANASAVVVSEHGRAAGFGLPPTSPLERAVIHGRVVEVHCGAVAGATVTIANSEVQAASDGTFRATIEARGVVLVSGRFPRRDVPSAAVSSATIRLDGRRDYRVPDLTLSNCMSE
jgi:outer membrane protein assembly factor BamB